MIVVTYSDILTAFKSDRKGQDTLCDSLRIITCVFYLRDILNLFNIKAGPISQCVLHIYPSCQNLILTIFKRYFLASIF